MSTLYGRKGPVLSRAVGTLVTLPAVPALVAAPVVWFDAGQGVTTVSGLVSQWNDISGNGRDVTQGTAINRPTMLLAALGTHPAVQFVAASSTNLKRVNVNLFGSGAYTVVACIRVDINVAVGGWFTNANGGANTGMSIVNVSNKISATHVGQANHSTTADATTGVFQVWTFRRAAAALPTLRINGASTALGAGSATLTDPGATADLLLGAYSGTTNFGNCTIAELFAYASSISDTQAREAEEYLYEKFGL